MLTLPESKPLFKSLRFWSKVNVFPSTVDIRSGKIREFPRWRMALWRILYLVAVLHCVYGLWDIFHTLPFRQDYGVLYHIPIEFDGIVAPSILHVPIATAFISNVHIVAKLFNELYSGPGGTNISTRRQWFQLNITELIGLGTSLIATGTIIFYLTLICIESNLSHLLINSSFLSTYRGNFGVVILAYCIEMYSTATWGVAVGFLVNMNALVIAKVQQDLKSLLTKFRRCESVEVVQKALKSSQNVQLYLQLYNCFNAWFVHAFKTTTILAAILHGYFGVRFRDNLYLTAYCWFIHLACIILYCGAFQRAYNVVEGQRHMKREIGAASRRVRNPNTRRKLLLEVRSLRSIGLKVGQFNDIERNSSLVFLDFVERQLIGLLVAF